MIDLAFLERLLELLNRSNADSIEIRRWSTTIRVSKSGGLLGAPPQSYHVVASPSSYPATPEAPAALVSEHGRAVSEPAGSPAATLLEIKSPMVGTFYTKPEPGAAPYVRVGSRISVGQTLCIIEAMKIMNPLDAEISGVIRETVVDDAQPVEFGQVLFRVDPNG